MGKTGSEIVAQFIGGLSKRKGLDPAVVDLIERLHKDKKLTEKNIANGLEEIRKEALR